MYSGVNSILKFILDVNPWVYKSLQSTIGFSFEKSHPTFLNFLKRVSFSINYKYLIENNHQLGDFIASKI